MDTNKIERLTIEEDDILTKELEIELNLAEVNYRHKKRLKGETIDEDKMRKALNQRKKIKQLCEKLLGSIIGKGIDKLRGP